MGLFDFFGGGTPAEKAQKQKAKITQKYGDPSTRQKAISTLIDLSSPETVPVLMQRFTFSVDPQTTDADEKQTVFEAICAMKREAVAPVVDFLKKSDSASSWALRILGEVLPEPEVVGAITDELTRLGAEYTRDPEKKEVLLHALEGKSDERIGPAVLPFLHDMSDDVKLAAIKTLAVLKYAPAREKLLKLLVAEETARRVQTACVQMLCDAQLSVEGYRPKVEQRLAEPFFLDKAGLVKKRG
jgi:HEAT repeat protein